MIKLEIENSLSDSRDNSRAHQAWQRLNQRADVGFQKLPEKLEMWNSCEQIAKEISAVFKNLIVIGIGGSSLGAESLIRSLRPSGAERVIFIDNYDMDEIQHKTKMLNLLDCAFYIVSKSGNSLFTLSLADFFIEKLKTRSAHWSKHVWVCTENKSSPLKDWASQNHIAILDLPLEVGGRFSVFTPAGLLPAAFSGISLQELRIGATNALNNLETCFQTTEFFIDGFRAAQSNTFFWFYSSMLKGFGPWLVQLWSESLGKPGANATVPVVCCGTIDQHSMLQQISEGGLKESAVFFHIESLEQNSCKIEKSEFSKFSYWQGLSLGQIMKAEFQGTREALATRKIPHLCFRLKDQSAVTIGELVLFFEIVVSLIGLAVGIDPFNQPGVELSKKITKDILTRSQESKT